MAKLEQSTVRQVSVAREFLLEHARSSQARIRGLLDSGHREYDKMHSALESYISFQTAADILGGYDFDGPAHD